MADRWNIQAGELRDRVTIQAKSATPTLDTRGHPKRNWTDVATNVSAKIETPTGRKLELARQLVPSVTHIITLRFRGLDEQNNRLSYQRQIAMLDGQGTLESELRIFNIGHQEDVENRHVKLILTCSEIEGTTEQ